MVNMVKAVEYAQFIKLLFCNKLLTANEIYDVQRIFVLLSIRIITGFE